MKKQFLPFTFFLLMITHVNILLAQSCPKWGPYAGAKQMGGDAELMIADVMIPAEGNMPFTYTCAIQFGLGKSGGYCGLQDGEGSDSIRPFNNIFSVWDYPNKVQLVHTYKDPMTFVGGFGNEGTGLHSHCDFGWKPGRWYTNVVRRWDMGGDKTYVAYFIYDQFKNEWRHYVTFAVPEAKAMLHGDISSFLENFADDAKRARTSNYKSYWKLSSDGTWIKPQFLEANAGEGNWKAESLGKDGLTLTSCGLAKINGEKKSFPVTSPDKQPVILSVAEVYDLGAYYNKGEKKITVDWSCKNSTAPQLAYRLDLYAGKEKKGKPLASVSGYGPEIREAVFPLTGMTIDQTTYLVELQITDIFNQQAKPKTTLLEELKP